MEAGKDLEEEEKAWNKAEDEGHCPQLSFSAAALANAQQGLDRRDHALRTDADVCEDPNEALNAHGGSEARGRLKEFMHAPLTTSV